MPTATEAAARRRVLAQAAGLALATCVPVARAARGQGAVVVAAWDDAQGRHHVGTLDAQARVLATVPVPTRAHGLALEPDGSVLAVARRPGDWLLRWHPARGRRTLHWNDGARRFNGHVQRIGAALFTTETLLDDGQGVVVVRDAATLSERAVWATHGRDPHALLADGDSTLWVANGGIGTDAATGRTKDTRAMDSSLVRLDAADGTLRGQWRLNDPKLSLRHLARADDGTLGIALQAEHEDAAARGAAPLLALWRNGQLRSVEGPACVGCSGYGGDIAAWRGRFFVSAPRAGALAAWGQGQGWETALNSREVCALGVTPERLWCGALDGLHELGGVEPARATALRLDNHLSPYPVSPRSGAAPSSPATG